MEKIDEKLTPIYQKLLNNSIFTEKQILVLLDYLVKKEIGSSISSGDQVTLFNKDKIVKGVYFRILNQAINKFKKLIYSVMLLNYLDIFDVTSIDKITSQIISSDDLEILDLIDKHIDKMIKER